MNFDETLKIILKKSFDQLDDSTFQAIKFCNFKFIYFLLIFYYN